MAGEPKIHTRLEVSELRRLLREAEAALARSEPRCTAKDPNQKTAYGHFEQSYFPDASWSPFSLGRAAGKDELNQCVWCHRISPNQPNDTMQQLANQRAQALLNQVVSA
jgi:cytochrome c553